jgi:predicted HTH transcriptional regulator
MRETRSTITTTPASVAGSVAEMRLKTRGIISNADYQRTVGASRRTAANDLRRLVAAGVFLREGRTGRSTHYLLARSNGH